MRGCGEKWCLFLFVFFVPSACFLCSFCCVLSLFFTLPCPVFHLFFGVPFALFLPCAFLPVAFFLSGPVTHEVRDRGETALGTLATPAVAVLAGRQKRPARGGRGSLSLGAAILD